MAVRLKSQAERVDWAVACTAFGSGPKSAAGFFTALVPRKRGEPAPRFETVLDGDGIRVTFANGRVDAVILKDECYGPKTHLDL